ncbi:hypothetical protein BHE74_00006772 [Ensete ventricosum]|nr:hypothetical protein BHE74_00006772 [Ensete ventricosum]
MRLGTRQEYVGSSPRVSRVFLGWRKGVRQKKTKTRQKIIGGSRKACQDLLGDSLKGSGSLLGTCREIAGRRPEDLLKECRRLPDWQELGLDYLDCERRVYRHCPGFRAADDG